MFYDSESLALNPTCIVSLNVLQLSNRYNYLSFFLEVNKMDSLHETVFFYGCLYSL